MLRTLAALCVVLAAVVFVLLQQLLEHRSNARALADEPAVETPARLSLLEERLRERFIVTTTAGRAFSGLLGSVDDRTLVLVDVSVIKDDGASLAVDGEVVLHRDAVAYMQKP